MGIIVKNADASVSIIKYKEDDIMKSLHLKPGRNILTQATWDKIKDHSGFKRLINTDKVTINTEGDVAKAPASKADFVYVESLAGNEDGKDILKEYALGYDIVLNKKMTFENMLSDFKKKYGE